MVMSARGLYNYSNHPVNNVTIRRFSVKSYQLIFSKINLLPQ